MKDSIVKLIREYTGRLMTASMKCHMVSVSQHVIACEMIIIIIKLKLNEIKWMHPYGQAGEGML